MATTGAFIGRRVGRFTITSHLASGGMAELFIARQEAVGGFEKDLVLKMLQERYAQNPRVVEMFLDEARLAAKLNHQNIVHVYDVDEADGVRYIAMEYIHGQTVTDIVRRSIARGAFLPLEHALHIVAETAAGLAYAHESLDPEGRPARIVHRDVSPSNILVTYEGLTKIVDFGIARVQDQIREESGMRPGKVSYMSPEQVRGEGADHRSDIFSLGIILYEITVGRRLWRGPAETVMRRIVEELIPPPTYVRRDYPPALELIVMKALERRPGDRHQSAAELQNDLNEFMDESGLKSGSRRLSQYMKDLFASDSNSGAARAIRTPMGTPAQIASAKAAAAEPDESEDLDFDRRAPLMMRVEARAEHEGGRDPFRGLAPVPQAMTARAGAPGRFEEGSGPVVIDRAFHAGAGTEQGGPRSSVARHDGSAAGAAGPRKTPVTVHQEEGGVASDQRGPGMPALAIQTAGDAAVSPPPRAAETALAHSHAARWAIALALFVTAVVVVFLATK